MEFVEGETLEHLIRRSGRVEVKLALEIVAQVATRFASVAEPIPRHSVASRTIRRAPRAKIRWAVHLHQDC
jgi:hypothetical protein